jgi:hypothetical protein
MIDQIPTPVPTLPAIVRGAPELAMLLKPIAAPNALKANWVAIEITKPENIGPHRTRS